MKTEAVKRPQPFRRPETSKYDEVFVKLQFLANDAALKLETDCRAPSALRYMRRMCRERGIKLHVRNLPDGLYVWADKPEAVKP